MRCVVAVREARGEEGPRARAAAQDRGEGVAAVAALGSGGFAFHEHHDKKESKDAAEDAEEEAESGRGEGKKKHHFFG